MIAGPWALQAFFDFVLLSGGVTWVRELADVEPTFPRTLHCSGESVAGCTM